jgi:ATP-binding cassette subfamily B protein
MGRHPNETADGCAADFPAPAQVSRKEAFRAMLAYARPHRLTFAAVFVFSLLSVSADLLQPYLVKIAIDEGLLTHPSGWRMLMAIGITYLLLAAFGMLFSYLQANLLQRAGQSIVAKLRKDLFRHVTRQSMSFFDRHPIGSLVTNVSSDTETISHFFTQVLQSAVRDGMLLVLIIVFMFTLDAELAAWCMILLPTIALIAYTFRSWLRSVYHRARSQLSRLIAFVAENLAGMGLVQAFHQEKEQERQFTEQNRQYLRANLREVRATVLFNRSFEVLGNVSVALLVWIGGYAVMERTLEFGVLYAFISYIRQFFQPINQITQQWNTLQSSLVSMERLWRIFSARPEVAEPDPSSAVPLRPEQVKGEVAFRNVSFAYDPDQPVLNRINLRVRPGEFVGIVGTTGAGKSTLVNLLARFYDVSEGCVEIDGTDVRRIPAAQLQRIVGLVQQEPFLFSGSIVDNVRLFDESIDRRDVIQACRSVGADRLIERLPDGYDTRLSERGSGLSAGERQLLSFARILVFRPRILILDEATAHLDSHSERMIQHALDVASRGRTTLVIAHRLSTVKHADRIIVMRHGRIEEEGSHRELLRRNGYYAELYAHSSGSGIFDAEGRKAGNVQS